MPLPSQVNTPVGLTAVHGGQVFFSREPRFWQALDEVMAPGGWILHERSVSALVRHQWLPYPVQHHAELLGLVAHRPTGSAAGGTFLNWCEWQFGSALTAEFFVP
ncbi:hypothetical protein ACFOW4_10700 [Micromonospora sp. GCM10011542]|uniref:hypothetical protein n=1 Tax=Micromonospora sp. GCM10011542 TaxID=3317337 RepID=UPI003621E30C